MDIGLIDADLLDNGTRHPNIALEKISAYKKACGDRTRLLLSYDEINDCDETYISKVFAYTKYPEDVLNRPNVRFGGTGFFFDNGVGCQ
jgi:hypothetical protein